ncbi:uncharacterized protein LOC123015534 [Tribolium madens]|uniref:uncharacterized protein LOC123015534 n=1 Tax=Tribolium madens TaxID=41895 RepID=UPI001CF73BF1|nr:uncharacterized protein LOC123015534 [Tribolium madens]
MRFVIFLLLWGVACAFTAPCPTNGVAKMCANWGNVVLLTVVFFHAVNAFPSRPDERNLANNEKYRLLKELLPALREMAAEDKFQEEKRNNQEIMTAFGNMKELTDILRSG